MSLQKKVKIALYTGIGIQTVTFGAELPTSSSTTITNTGDWCEWLQNKFSLVHTSPTNAYLQSLQLGGMLHYQAAYIDGEDINGGDFHKTFQEFRRVRLETNAYFLDFFHAKIAINVAQDHRRTGGDIDWGFQDFDQIYLQFNIKKSFAISAIDSLNMEYGCHKFNMTKEVHMSSNEIYTIERSAIANKLFGVNNRPSGFNINASKGDWVGRLGLYSGEDDAKGIGAWNDGMVY